MAMTGTTMSTLHTSIANIVMSYMRNTLATLVGEITKELIIKYKPTHSLWPSLIRSGKPVLCLQWDKKTREKFLKKTGG